jgi:hypothetical protein
LRQHAEAGPLLQSLEDWLHRPEPAADVDIAALLVPYRDMPAHELDAQIGAGPAAADPALHAGRARTA